MKGELLQHATEDKSTLIKWPNALSNWAEAESVLGKAREPELLGICRRRVIGGDDTEDLIVERIAIERLSGNDHLCRYG